MVANAGLRPGQVVVAVGGLPAVVAITPNGAGDALRVSGAGFVMSLAAVGADGRTAPVSSGGVLQLVQGRNLVVQSTGFAPNSLVSIYLMSDPVLLGRFTTDAAGSFSGSVLVPSTVPVGAHTAQVNGYTATGVALSVSLGVRLASAQPTKVLSTRLVFGFNSARLTPVIRASLRALVAKVPKDASVSSVVVGVVRARGAGASVRALVKARGEVTVAYLKKIEPRGTSMPEPTVTITKTNVTARYVTVVIHYTK